MMDSLNFSVMIDRALERLTMLFSGHLFSGLSSNTEIIGTLLTITVGLCLAWLLTRNFHRKALPALMLLAAFFLFYLFAPFKIQVRWIPERTTIYLFLVSFLALSVLLSRYRHVANRVGPLHLIITISALLTFLSTYYHSTNLITADGYYKEYLSGLATVEPNSRILAIRVVSPMPDSVGAHLHHKLLQGGSYYAVLKNSVDVKLFHAQSKFVPIRYRAERNPYIHWISDREIVSPVPTVDFDGFSKISEHPLDYVLVWGNISEALKYPRLAAPLQTLLESIDRNFELVDVSQPNGYMHLFRNRKL